MGDAYMVRRGSAGSGNIGYPPSNIIGITATAGNASATIKWTDPNDTIVEGVTYATWGGTKLVRKAGSYPNSITDGVVVLDSVVRNAYSVTGFTDSGLTNGTTYYYQLFPYSDTGAVNTNTSNRISVTPNNYKIMTLNIDLTNSNPSTCCSYADDAVGMTTGSSAWDTFFGHKPCLFKDGAVVCYLNPNDYTKDVNGNTVDITSGTAGDVMVEFPRRGLTISTVGTALTVKMTDNPSDVNFEYNAHIRGATAKDNFYLGAYKGYSASSKLRSLSGKTPTVSQTIGAFRTLAQANGSGYEQEAFYQLTFVQCMYLLKYKNLDSQSTVGMGYVKSTNTASITTGGANLYGMDCEVIKVSNPTYVTDQLHQSKLFGIEDIWGNLWEWVDGITTTTTRNILTATTAFNNTGSGYADQGQGATANIGNFMSKPQGTTKTGFIAKEVSGSATTYFSDYAELNASKVAYFGGAYPSGSEAGVFALNIYPDLSVFHPTVGARLMYL